MKDVSNRIKEAYKCGTMAKQSLVAPSDKLRLNNHLNN